MSKLIPTAEYILSKKGSMSCMKLQKLVYYSQAWHLAWTEKPLFHEKIQAWKDGPVSPKLFSLHKGQFKVSSGFFLKKSKSIKTTPLSDDDKDIINRIIKYYGDKDPHWLSQLTHLEDPWKKARSKIGAKDGDSASVEISHQAMFEYYSSL